MTLLLSLGISLLATLGVELLFALVTRKRGRGLAVVTAVNLLTNPTLVLIWQVTQKDPLFFLSMELAAALIEGCCYRLFPSHFQRPFLFSFICNFISCTIGIIMNGGIL